MEHTGHDGLLGKEFVIIIVIDLREAGADDEGGWISCPHMRERPRRLWLIGLVPFLFSQHAFLDQQLNQFVD